MVVFGRHRTNTDIYPPTLNPGTTFLPHWPLHSTTSPTSPHHILNLPPEILHLILHAYIRTLNLPPHFYHHLTLLGYWSTPSSTTPPSPHGWNLGRKIYEPLTNLLLVCRRFRDEGERALYGGFVFYVHPSHAVKRWREMLYNPGKERVGPVLPTKVQNVQFNIVFDPRVGGVIDWRHMDSWRGAWLWIAANFECLRKVALAIDFKSTTWTEGAEKALMPLVLCFIQIFKQKGISVNIRWAGVQYEQYAWLRPASNPLHGDLLDEEKKLLELRDERKWTWYKVAREFGVEGKKSELWTVEGLQARYRRLKNRERLAARERAFLGRLRDRLREREEAVGDQQIDGGT